MAASLRQLTLRTRPAKYAFMFLGLAAIFSYFCFEDYQAQRINETMIWIAVLSACAGGALLAFASHRAIGQMTLMQSGSRARATITSVGKVKFMRAGDTFTELRYRYESSPGQAHEGKSGLLLERRRRDWKVGDSADIRFDDAKPSRSVWIGDPE